MVLTDEQKQNQYPAATLEGALDNNRSMIAYEKQFYTIDNAYVTEKTDVPGWTTGNDYANNNGNPPPNTAYPSNYTVNSEATSERLYKINGSTNKTGLGIVLKVMAGDKIDIHGKSYYQSTQTFNNSNSTSLLLSDILGGLLGAPDKVGLASKSLTESTLETLNTGVIPGTFIRGANGESTTVPKAYINYILLDEQFRYVSGGFSRVGTSGTVKNHWFDDTQLQGIAVSKNGYIYVYASNESNADVFFDNLQVFHTNGPLVEENHYYPFGLTMSGISSKSLSFGTPQNKMKFNGKEEQANEFVIGGLDWYDYKYRFYDQQLGRFFTQDRLADKYVYYAPYQFAGNEVPNAIDLDGLEPMYTNPRQMLYQAGGDLSKAMGKLIDRVGAWFSVKHENTQPTSSPGTSLVTTVETKTTVSPNFGGFLSYVEANNSNAGYTDPLFSVSTKTSVKSAAKTSITAGAGTVTMKVSPDGSTEVSGEATMPVSGVPVTAGVTLSNDSKTGEQKFKIDVGTGIGPTKAKASLQVVTSPQGTTTSVGLSVEQKKGTTKTTTSVGISY